MYDNYIGLTVDDARKQADAEDLTLRVVSENGIPKAVTMDMRANRLNVAIRDGIVTSIRGIK